MKTFRCESAKARKLRYITAFLGLATSCVATAEPVCWEVNWSCYEQITEPLSWTEAKADAETRVYRSARGHLATITSQEEQDFLMENLPELGANHIGGFQTPGSSEPDGGWAWVTGEPFVYTSWAAGEPNDDATGEDGLEVNLENGVWNDVRLGQRAMYVVEYPNQKPREYVAVDMLSDINGNGFPEVAALGKKNGRIFVNIKDTKTGRYINDITFFSQNWEPISISVGDVDQNGVPDLWVLAVNKNNGNTSVEYRDAMTRKRIRGTRFPK